MKIFFSKKIVIFLPFLAIFTLGYINISVTQATNTPAVHLYPALGADSSISITDLRIEGVLFLAQDEDLSTIPNWKENMESIFSQIKTFMETQFNNRIQVTYTIFPQPVQGGKRGQDYILTELPSEVMAKNQEIAQWFNDTTGHRILIIYAKGQIRGANESPPGYGLSPTGRFVVNPGFWLEDQGVSGNNKYGIIRFGVIGSAHELGHALGILHPWDMPENVNNDPNYGNVPGNIMGYNNTNLELNQTYFEDIIKQRMGLTTNVTSTPTETPTSTGIPTPTSTPSPTTTTPSQPRFPDTNGDNRADQKDLEKLIQEFGKRENNLNSDFNQDGTANILDYELLRRNFNTSKL